MQTAAIPYRVADFLKEHPPFQFIPESDLVALAARGRVRFHEPDEYICWQSSPHTPFVYVIQQGAVSLWDESVNPPVLRDILAAGDAIGIERFNGSPNSLYSAKSASEVVVYALQAAALEPLLAQHPRAAEYVAAHSAVTAGYTPPAGARRPHQIAVADLVTGRAPIHCAPSTAVREAAALLLRSGAQSLALADGNEVTALLGVHDLLRWIAAGAQDPDQPASNLVSSPLLTIPPETSVSDCVLAMSESRSASAAITTDGSPVAPLYAAVTAVHLAPAFGDHPVAILQEIAVAPRLDSLRALNARARSWLLDNLTEPPALDWLASWADLVNRRIFERILELAGPAQPATLYCFYGPAGRAELLTAVAPRIAAIGPSAPTPVASLETALAECGYFAPSPIVSAGLEEWKARFSAWIRDPIGAQTYQSRCFFDLRPVHGAADVFLELQSHILAEVKVSPAFLRVAANDCLSTLPPITFFRDLVVEESGKRTDTFHIGANTLQPLADVARVFSLASGARLGLSTRERFREACRLLPARDAVLTEAAETTRVVLFHQARAGLRLNTSGDQVPLSFLSRHDRQILKSAFRSLYNLLEFAASGEWLEQL